MEKIEVKDHHLKIIQELDFEKGPYGGPCLDETRPFGNSDIVQDIIEILELYIPDDDNKASKMYSEIRGIWGQVPDVLNILCQNLRISKGVYVYENYQWVKQKGTQK